MTSLPSSRPQDLAARFQALEPDFSRRGPLWLQKLRREALRAFSDGGFPGPGDEAWRETPLAPFLAHDFVIPPPLPPSAAAQAAVRATRATAGTPCLVLLNGVYSPVLSDPGAASSAPEVLSLADALRRRPEALEPDFAQLATMDGFPFTALNTAFFSDGVFVRIPAGATVDPAITVLHVVDDTTAAPAVYPRILVSVGDRASVTVIERFCTVGTAATHTAAVTELVCGDGAQLQHVRIQAESAAAFHFSRVALRTGTRSRATLLDVSLGGRLVRNDAGAVLGEGADVRLAGLYIAGQGQHIDNHTLIDHAAPQASSREIYKGVLHDQARAVFSGRIVVRHGAQHTDAKQSNRNLLLSADATVHTRPQLEIYADDVKCTHGATIGQLDEEALFYLRARGIDVDTARDLLVEAFAAELLDDIPGAALRGEIGSQVQARLRPAPVGA